MKSHSKYTFFYARLLTFNFLLEDSEGAPGELYQIPSLVLNVGIV